MYCCSHTIPHTGNGVVNPARHFQRYRHSEYSHSKPFYQWWYYYIQDLELNKHYAFAYGTTTCNGVSKPHCIYDGTYVLFAEIDNKKNTRFQRIDMLPRANMHVSDDFHVRIFNTTAESAIRNNQEPLFELFPKDDNTFQLSGFLQKNSIYSWIHDNCDSSLEIKWNVTLSRVYGYFAQDVFELPDEFLEGIIMWNTYTHNSLVYDGVIKIADNVNILCHKQDPTKVRFRGYGDGNWGQIMPSNEVHPEDKNYSWGWYLSHIPNKDPAKDVSVIAGVGKTYTSFPLYTMDGRFADVRVNSSLHLEFRQVIVYGQVMSSCNDGKLVQFTVDRNNWQDINDSFGSAKIPLEQTVTLESTHYLVVQKCTSVETNYNRLLFAFKDAVFSDFEGLGVTCRVTIKYKVTGEVIVDQENVLSGIEYGFNYKVKNIPPTPY
jgi:hypothetical protein